MSQILDFITAGGTAFNEALSQQLQSSVAQSLGPEAGRTYQQIERARELAEECNAPVPSMESRKVIQRFAMDVSLAVISNPRADLLDVTTDMVASRNGGLIFMVDHKTTNKRLTFRVPPEGERASVSEVGPDGVEGRFSVRDFNDILPLVTWLVSQK